MSRGPALYAMPTDEVGQDAVYDLVTLWGLPQARAVELLDALRRCDGRLLRRAVLMNWSGTGMDITTAGAWLKAYEL